MIDTKNLRMLAGAANKPVFVDFMTTVELLELLDALERKDRVLREALEAIEIAKNGLDWFKDSYPHDVNESDAEASEQINEAIEAITKELAP